MGKRYNVLHADGGIQGPGFQSIDASFNYIKPTLTIVANDIVLAFVSVPQNAKPVDPVVEAPVMENGNTAISAQATATEMPVEPIAGAPEPIDDSTRLIREMAANLMLVQAPLNVVTTNQKSAWSGFKTLGIDSPLFNTVLLSTKNKPFAYDTLTGEVHASLSNALISDSQMIGNAVTSRIRNAFDGIAPKGQSEQTVSPAPLAYGPEEKHKVHEAFALVLPQAATKLWGQAYGSWSRLDGNGNASGVSSKTGGLVTGFDGIIDDDLFGTQWRAGLLGGYGKSSVNSLYGKAYIDSYQMGAYGGAKWDALGLRLGLNLAHHEVETERDVHFGSIHGEHSSDYGANSIQVFGELGYEFKPAQGFAVEPFAGVRYVSVKTDAFEESGTISQLSALAGRTKRTSSTLGLRASYQFALNEDISAMIRSTIGWDHGFGDLTPQQRLSFAGAAPFTIEGLPVARNAVFIKAGADFNLGRRTTWGLTYTGQYSQSSRANGVNADITIRF